MKKLSPMIHVPDVRATAEWYQNLGFTLKMSHTNEGEDMSGAMLSYGDNDVLFNEGGTTSEAWRREVDLYLYTDRIDELFDELKNRVDVVEPLHDTFYGMREFIIRDLNRFWITFGQPVA